METSLKRRRQFLLHLSLVPFSLVCFIRATEARLKQTNIEAKTHQIKEQLECVNTFFHFNKTVVFNYVFKHS